MDWNKILEPIAAAVLTALGGLIVAGINRLVAAIHQQPLATEITKLVSAAESQATDPANGPQKLAWVEGKIAEKFPTLNPEYTTALIEGAVQEMNAGQATPVQAVNLGGVFLPPIETLPVGNPPGVITTAASPGVSE